MVFTHGYDLTLQFGDKVGSAVAFVSNHKYKGEMSQYFLWSITF